MADLDTLRSLDAALNARRTDTDLYVQYFEGDQILSFATQKFREAFGHLLRAFADNWCEVIVMTPAERLHVDGFRGEDGIADDEAWQVWQQADMDLKSHAAHVESIKTGYAYVKIAGQDGNRVMFVLPASQAITLADPLTGERTAGLHEYVRPDGHLGAVLLLPSGAIEYMTVKPLDDIAMSEVERREWQTVSAIEYDFGGKVPLVPLVNEPDTLACGHSDLRSVKAMQDGINKLICDMIIASEYVAFPQRVLTGIEIPKDPDTGEPLPTQELRAAMSRLWSFEPPDAKITQLNEADLSPYTNAISLLLQHVAAQTRTPPHYLLGQMVNVSGDALAAAESGLVKKVEGKQRSFAIAWREVIQIATARYDERFEVVWQNPERVSLAQIADALVKLRQLGLPLEELWRRAGYSPFEIERLKGIRGLPDVPPPGATDRLLPPTTSAPVPGADMTTPGG